ncbi:hypothetical protein ACIGN6_10805 [Streptomyces sp. NPDC053792]|uniref:hypothetical protein n=1 Tax=Streptomyces sp. NPDC053792 TaxID=3365716 RepID=UPI0037CEB211
MPSRERPPRSEDRRDAGPRTGCSLGRTQTIRDRAADPERLGKLGLGNVDAAAAVKAATAKTATAKTAAAKTAAAKR